MFVDWVGVVLGLHSGFLNCGGFMIFDGLPGFDSRTSKDSTGGGVTSWAGVLPSAADLLFPLFLPFLAAGWLNPADFVASKALEAVSFS